VRRRRPTDPQYHAILEQRNETNRQLQAAETTSAERRARLASLRVDVREAERTHSRSAQLDKVAALLGLILAELRAVRITLDARGGGNRHTGEGDE